MNPVSGRWVFIQPPCGLPNLVSQLLEVCGRTSRLDPVATANPPDSDLILGSLVDGAECVGLKRDVKMRSEIELCWTRFYERKNAEFQFWTSECLNFFNKINPPRYFVVSDFEREGDIYIDNDGFPFLAKAEVLCQPGLSLCGYRDFSLQFPGVEDILSLDVPVP